jgi:L-histidine Nalpha-methyltransferase
MINESDIEELKIGLNSKPKKIPSRFFYDENGDKLFIEIMKLPEYYLTRAENQILEKYSNSIISYLNFQKKIRILEPGAGDGRKFAILYRNIIQKNQIIFSPIDISKNVLQILNNNLINEFPSLQIESIVSDYKHLNSHIPALDEQKILLFLGSNLGNYTEEESLDYLAIFTKCLKKNDLFLLGVDLVKDPNTILSAYNDKDGITSKFNLNLLNRLNEILNANFNQDNFFHYPIYNPILHQAESYLISEYDQMITSKVLNEKFHFKKFEAIQTEISRKYRISDIETFAQKMGMEIIETFTDVDSQFCCSLWKK